MQDARNDRPVSTPEEKRDREPALVVTLTLTHEDLRDLAWSLVSEGESGAEAIRNADADPQAAWDAIRDGTEAMVLMDLLAHARATRPSEEVS